VPVPPPDIGHAVNSLGKREACLKKPPPFFLPISKKEYQAKKRKRSSRFRCRDMMIVMKASLPHSSLFAKRLFRTAFTTRASNPNAKLHVYPN
jgi:hypothetical protein